GPWDIDRRGRRRGRQAESRTATPVRPVGEAWAMRRQRSVILAVLPAAAGLVAVGPSSTLAQDAIKFGVPTPLSGPAAPWGIPHKNATELIFDEINAHGGLDVGGKKYKLEVVAYDHKYGSAEGAATV